MKKGRRALAITLALTLAASMVPTVFAEDSMPLEGQGAKGAHQPNNHGYRPIDVANFSEDTDNYAQYTKAMVPLQERNEAFAGTQANPMLSPKTQMAWVSGDYGNSKFESYQTNDNFGNYLFNFWQYTDVYAPWHGMPTAEYPEEWYYENPGSPGFEGGTIYPPNPAYTNAAHKNGALSLACVFFPRPGQDCKSMLVKDENGNFPVAEGMIRMARYYGFDGYFFNQEVTFQKELVPDYKEFLTVLQDAGLYTQWYDAVNNNGSLSYQNAFNKNNSPWLEEDGVRYNDSIFVNYAWQGRVQSSYDYANSIGVDPWQSMYFAVECDKARLSGGHTSSSRLEDYIWSDVEGQTLGSIALFRPEFVHACVTDPDEQWKVFERERMFYTSPNQDALNTEKDASIVRNDLNLNTGNSYEKGVTGAYWNGVSHYITERSVIDGANFTSTFNTGHGMQYYKDGQVSRDEEWSNINIQDILPTWQWWIDTEGTKLNVDFDYGPEYYYGPNNTYTQVGGYEGGSSLVVNGNLDEENFLRLYKTDLSVNENSKVSITYNKASADDTSKMEIGVIFKNDPETVVTFNVPQANKQTDGWVTKEINLGDYAGEEIAAIGVNFDNGSDTIENYQMNIGKLSINDGTDDTPAVPENFSIEKVFDTKEAYVSWDIADYSDVVQYNLYAEKEDGKREYLGGIYDDHYYLKNLDGLGDITKLLLTAVSPNGYESQPAEINYDFNKAVTGIQVEENAGYLDVSWNAAEQACKEIHVKVSFDYAGNDQVYEQTVAADATSARVLVPVADGSRYTVTVSTVNEDGSINKGASATGRIKDCYSAPYNYDVAEPYTSTRQVRLEAPSSIDWWYMYVSVDGGTETSILRGKKDMNNLSIKNQNGFMKVVLKDYRENLSEPKLVAYSKDFDAEITEKDFPDAALLNAVKEQAGTTIRDVMLYDGALDFSNLPISDLTGLSLLGNAKEINLSGTNITKISKDDFGGKYGALTEKIDLSNCASLTEIEAGALEGLDNLKEINLTGCTALQTLNLNNTALEVIQCDDASALAGVTAADLSGSKFDFSEGTPEKAFVDALTNAQTDISNQQPAAYIGLEESVRFDKTPDVVVNMRDCLNQAAKTVRGTSFEDLKDAGFIDPSYDLTAAAADNDIQEIRVTNPQGAVNMDTVDLSQDGAYTVEYITYTDSAVNGKVVATQTVYVRGITTVLESIIANAEKLLENGALDNTMEAVVEEFNAALANAKEFVAKDGATQQEINDATERLLKAMAKVDWKQGDKTVLEVAVDIANTIKPDLDLYVEEGKQEFLDALATAEGLLASGNAWQDDIDAATDALMEAMANLRMAPNKDILNDLIGQASGLNLDGYTEDSAAALNAALANAQTVAANENATQDEVDAAADTLKAAMSGLVFVNGDGNNAAEGNTTETENNGTTGTAIPAGDGTAPTKTGDAGAAGLAALAVLSVGTILVLKKKER